MKKYIFAMITAFVAVSAAGTASAQMMERNLDVSQEIYEHTVKEEAEGKELWQKLQAKQISCDSLSDENFGAFGEYFMGVMMGDSHATMNAMMIQMHGQQGEEQIHIVMGKRLSGCDTAASFQTGTMGWMPMMNMMMGTRLSDGQGWSSPFGFNSINNMMSMMNFGYGFGIFGFIFMLLWWALIIAAIVYFVRWLVRQSKGAGAGKSALDILKERYARGEIDKKEFEDKKKDLI